MNIKTKIVVCLILVAVVVIIGLAFATDAFGVKGAKGNPCNPPPSPACRCFYDRHYQTCLCLCNVR